MNEQDILSEGFEENRRYALVRVTYWMFGSAERGRRR